MTDELIKSVYFSESLKPIPKYLITIFTPQKFKK